MPSIADCIKYIEAKGKKYLGRKTIDGKNQFAFETERGNADFYTLTQLRQAKNSLWYGV